MSEEPILHNVRILDFTWVLAGPYATRLLADFGAEVIKVQPVGTPPPATPFARAYESAWNRDKRSITLDPGKPEGRELALKLAALSDVVVENFTPRVMANWALDYDALRAVKSDLVMVSLSAMGHDGPDSGRAGFAPTVHAAAGLTGLVTSLDGEPLGPGFSYADHIAGLYAAMAVLAALERRDATGEGQFVDISQQEALVSLLGAGFVDVADAGPVPDNLYPCREGEWCAVTVNDDAAWVKFVEAVGSPAWAADERFCTLSGRRHYRGELDRFISDWTRQRSADEVMLVLQSYGVAAGKVEDAHGLFNDPQLTARGFVLDRPDLGPLADASPIHLSDAPTRYEKPALLPGADNEYVYGQLLGLSLEERRRLRAARVI